LGIDFLTFSFLLENGAKTKKDFSKRVNFFLKKNLANSRFGTTA